MNECVDDNTEEVCEICGAEIDRKFLPRNGEVKGVPAVECPQCGQTLIASSYKFGGIDHGYGFGGIECYECGKEELLYDQKQDIYYCPIHPE